MPGVFLSRTRAAHSVAFPLAPQTTVVNAPRTLPNGIVGGDQHGVTAMQALFMYISEQLPRLSHPYPLTPHRGLKPVLSLPRCPAWSWRPHDYPATGSASPNRACKSSVSVLCCVERAPPRRIIFQPAPHLHPLPPQPAATWPPHQCTVPPRGTQLLRLSPNPPRHHLLLRV